MSVTNCPRKRSVTATAVRNARRFPMHRIFAPASWTAVASTARRHFPATTRACQNAQCYLPSPSCRNIRLLGRTHPLINWRIREHISSPRGLTVRNITFAAVNRLAVLHRGLLRLARDFGWQLEAWAVFSNHYHFVAHSPVNEPDASSLRAMLSLLHEKTAKWVNRLDRAPGRKVWFNYRETRLTFQKSYLARLNYTHQNAVKHKLVAVAHLYPWCSASWLERTASAAQVRAIYRFQTNRLKLDDEIEVATEW